MSQPTHADAQNSHLLSYLFHIEMPYAPHKNSSDNCLFTGAGVFSRLTIVCLGLAILDYRLERVNKAYFSAQYLANNLGYLNYEADIQQFNIFTHLAPTQRKQIANFKVKLQIKENQLTLAFVSVVNFAPKEAKPSGNYCGWLK
ncbi:hypothetical protein ACROAE_19670 [Shewanella sp. MF05960]|uniref:hypothetical protein n=1 Tax=Shewanella sp. MF05960 TaxID=3434874 RepID=UPI003D79473E